MNLSIKNASKTYGKNIKALNNISLTLEPGMFGLLGPNGAGKSTLMRTIATLQMLDAPLKGYAEKEEREKLVNILLEKTNLWEHRHKKLKGYSGGMKQRFGIAQALISKPKVIIVDEPTAGLDPIERNKFLTLLREIGTENIVLLSTHIVDDVKDLCTNMAIMNKGQIVFKGTPKAAVDSLKGKVWTRILSKEELNKVSQDHTVLSQNYDVDNKLHVQLLSDSNPGTDYKSLEPTLEHFYYSEILKKEPTIVNA